MKAEAFQRLQSLFDEALRQPTAQRIAWAEGACPDDPALRAELLRLLRIEQHTAGEFEDGLVVELGAAARALSEKSWAVGARIGRYRVLREIGRGGMGRVYAALFDDGGVEREVAIKVLHREAWTEGLARRFLRERRLLAALQHPGIARLLDVGESSEGEPYLVMELVDGEPIHQYVARHRLALEQRLGLFRQVLRAVSHAHRNLILHRDLKPGNVLVDADGHVHLLDFGIAKMVGVEEDLTRLHGRMLTPVYAAPEQLDGLAESGVSSDVYSLGALLYELLAGRPPVPREGLSTGEFERRVRDVPPPPLPRAALEAEPAILGVDDVRTWARRLSGDVDAVVQRALRKSPGDRYPSVDAFDDDLGALLDRRPVRARSGGRFYRLQRFVARHRWGTASAVAASLVVTVAAVAFIQQAGEVRRERDRAQAAVEVLRESFAAADPLRASDSPVTARGVLEGAGQRILALMKDDPGTYLPVAFDLAETQLSLGLVSDDSAAWIDVALAQDGMDPALHLRRDLLEAALAVSREDVQRARALVEDLRTRHPGHPDVVILQARLAIREDREDDARALLEPLWESGLVNRRDFSRVAWFLADALRFQRRFADAREVLERALASQGAPGDGALRPDAMITAIRLADVEVGLGEAESALRRLDGIRTDVARYFGQRSTTYALLQGNRARALSATGDHEAASRAFAAAADAYAGSLGSTHRNTLRSRFNEAQSMAFVPARRDEALALFALVEDSARSTMAADDPLLRFIRLERIGALQRAGRWSDARDALLTVLASPTVGGAEVPVERRIAQLAERQLAPDSGCRPSAAGSAPLRERLALQDCSP